MAALMLTGMSSVAMADSDAVAKYQVLNVTQKYAESTSCGHSFERGKAAKLTSIKDIYPIYSDEKTGIAEYYIFWSGDKGCKGGNGSSSFHMSEVSKLSKSRPFVVQNDKAFGDNVDINFRFISNVKQINSKHFEIISRDYADATYGGKDGGNNLPANTFKYTVQKIAGKGWKVTDKVLLEQRK